MNRVTPLAFTAVALLLLSGCNPQQEQEVERGMGNTARTVQTGAQNALLASKVKSAILTRSSLKGSSINVDAVDGKVVLKGTVKNREQAALAEEVARDTDGVTEVSNELNLLVPAT